MLSTIWANTSRPTTRVTVPCRVGVRTRISLILICVLAPLCLQAQNDPCDAAILGAPTPIPPKPPVCPSPPLPPAPAPDNLVDATKSALACAWIDRTDDVLEAFRLLTSGPPISDLNQKLYASLDMASLKNEDLFRAVLGNPDKYGQPTVQGLPDLVDTISKAGRRGTVEPKDKVKYQIKLFSCTQSIIDKLFDTPTGKTAMVEVNDAFTRKDNYVALYKLHKEVWGRDGSSFDADHLEKLRAAFAVSVDDLAKQVGLKITTASK